MEINYKLRIFGATEEDPSETLFFEELGQAIIAAKTYGHETKEKRDDAAIYCWYVKNIKDKPEKYEIRVVYGEYTRDGRPIINRITTY